jgi:hypothetical protein
MNDDLDVFALGLFTRSLDFRPEGWCLLDQPWSALIDYRNA